MWGWVRASRIFPWGSASRMSRHFAFRDYPAAYEYIGANRETTMKVLIDVDGSEE